MNIQQLVNPKVAEKWVSAQIQQSRRYKRATAEMLYSSHLFPVTAPAAEYPVFTTGYGQVGQGYANPLTWRETNQPTNGLLPQESDFVCFSIGVHVAEEKLADAVNGRPFVMKDFLEHAVPWLDLPDYKRSVGPAFMCPSGGGVSGYSVENNASIMNNGAAAFGARYKLAVPIIFPAGSTMQVSIRLTGADGFAALTNTATFDAWLSLDCLRYTRIITG